MERVAVVGTTASGKTTMVRALAARLDVPTIELDALHWGRDWTPRHVDDVRAEVDRATSRPTWVACGNYSKVRDLVWRRADTIVWLDYPLPVVLWRLTRRTLRRILRREVRWHGNRERFRAQFLSRESLYVWALQTHADKRRRYPVEMARPEYGGVKVVRLRLPATARRWLHGMKGAGRW